MKAKDILSKKLFKCLVRDFATYLFDLPVTQVELLDTNLQRAEERRADLVARVRLADGAPFILHIEIQNDNLARMPVRMMRYLTDILLAYPGLQVRQYVVYIGKAALTMPDFLELPCFRYRYDIIDMHRIDCQSLLGQDSPDAWVLAVLCDFGGEAPRAIVRTILSKLLERFHEQTQGLREYVQILEILGSNRDLNLSIDEELDMLTIDFEKLPTYQRGMKIGMEQGMEKGMEKGMEQSAKIIARKLLARKMAVAEVAAVTGLTVPQIEALSAGKNNTEQNRE